MPNPSDNDHPRPPPGIAEWRDGQGEIVAEILALFAAGYRLIFLDLPTGWGKGPICTGVAYHLGGRNTYTSTTKYLQGEIANKVDGAMRLMGRSNYPSVYDPKLSCDRCRDRSLCPDPKDNGGVEACAYKMAKIATLAAPLAVLNTSYQIAETNHVGLFSGRDLLILDEGEAVEEKIRTAATVRISRYRIVKKLGLEPPADGAGLGDVLKWVQVVLLPGLNDAIEHCERLVRRNPSAGAARDLAGYEQLRQAIRFQTRAGEADLVGYVTDDHAVVLEPISAAPFGQSMLWRHAELFLLASGSLIDPAAVSAELGWTDRYEVISRPSPFTPEQHRIIGRPVGSMSKTNEVATLPKMAAELRRILDDHPTDRILVHTVSYGRASTLADLVDDPRIIVATKRAEVSPEVDGDRPDVELERYKTTPGAVLFTPRHERGVDLPDDLCRVIAIVKSPLDIYNDPRVVARRNRPGGDRWYSSVAPARRILQGSGRGTRNPGDWCVIYLLDSDLKWIKLRQIMPQWWIDAVAR